MFRAYRVLVVVPAVLAMLNLALAMVALANGPCLPQDAGGC
ncbi:MAG: hypothetical protein ACRDGT_12950 [Candidatus Limnocylindria bacterium]